MKNILIMKIENMKKIYRIKFSIVRIIIIRFNLEKN